MPAVVIAGAQWGDEGKGKIVDLLGRRAHFVVRFQGGNNAGHTLVVDGVKTVLHLVPSGVLQPSAACVIGPGVVVDPSVFAKELQLLSDRGLLDDTSRLKVSGNSALIMPYHCALDRAREGARAAKIGTTGRGIGPTYEDVASRRSIPMNALQDVEDLHARVEQVLPEKNAILAHYGAKTFTSSEVVDHVMTYASRIVPHIAETGQLIDQALIKGSKVLFEGAQGALLDVVHGTVPYVTSSHTVGAAACTGTGIGPNRISRVLGVAKAYVTRVGGGPMPTAIGGEKEEKLRQLGGEFGATTGRPRRCGWLDLPALRYAVRISGITELALTKLDVLSGLGDLKICTAYRLHGETLAHGIFPAADGLQQVEPVFETVPGWDQDISHIRKEGHLPKAAQEYITRIEEELGVRITILSVGADREATLQRGFEF